MMHRTEGQRVNRTGRQRMWGNEDLNGIEAEGLRRTLLYFFKKYVTHGLEDGVSNNKHKYEEFSLITVINANK